MVKYIKDEGYAQGNEEWERCETSEGMNLVHFSFLGMCSSVDKVQFGRLDRVFGVWLIVSILLAYAKYEVTAEVTWY
jgi:hypothetical protein